MACTVLVVGICFFVFSPASLEVPTVEWARMEPQVVAKLQNARLAVLRERRSPVLWGRLGMIFHAHDFTGEAKVCYSHAMELSPTEYRWPYLIALTLYKDFVKESVEYFERAVKLAPKNAAAYTNFGDTLAQLGEKERAREQYRIALQLDPRCNLAMYGLGQLSFLEGNPRQALEHLMAAAKIAPQHGELHKLLAQIYHRLGEKEKAELEDLRAQAHPLFTWPEDPVVEAVQAEAVNSRHYALRGRNLTEAGRFSEAEKYLRRVLEIRPATSDDYINLGVVLFHLKKEAEAIEQYQLALKLDPLGPHVHNRLGIAYAETGQLQLAAKHLLEAIRLDPSYADAYNNFGYLCDREGRLDQAMEYYFEALRFKPALVRAHANIANALGVQGKIDEAIVHWRKANAIHPEDPSVLFDLTLALNQRGRHQEAIACLREGQQMAPNNARISTLLAWNLAAAPQTELRNGAEAVQLALRVFAKYPKQPEVADVLAAALAETGDFEGAIRLAKEAIGSCQSPQMSDLAEKIRARLQGYEKRQPYRLP